MADFRFFNLFRRHVQAKNIGETCFWNSVVWDLLRQFLQLKTWVELSFHEIFTRISAAVTRQCPVGADFMGCHYESTWFRDCKTFYLTATIECSARPAACEFMLHFLHVAFWGETSKNFTNILWLVWIPMTSWQRTEWTSSMIPATRHLSSCKLGLLIVSVLSSFCSFIY